MATEFLPSNAQIHLSEVLEALHSAPSKLGVDRMLVLRAIAYRQQGVLVPFAVSVSLGDPGAKHSDCVLRAREALLVRSVVSIGKLRTLKALSVFLRTWRSALDPKGPVYELQETANVNWQSGRWNGFPIPHWKLSLYEMRPEVSSQQPNGPFTNTKSGFIETTLGSAAAVWLGDEMLRQQPSPRREIDLRIFDPRAYIKAVTRQDGSVEVLVTQTKKVGLICVGAAIPSQSALPAQRVRVVRGKAVLKVPPDGMYLEIDLVGTNDTHFDRDRIALHPALGGNRFLAQLEEPDDASLDDNSGARGQDAQARTIPATDLLTLHPEIAAKCARLRKPGTYAEAVEKSFKIVRDRLRKLTTFERAADAFGKGKLRIKGAAAAHVEDDFNEGAKFLMMAIDMFRNEKSHTADSGIDDPHRANLYLAVSSLALTLLDQAELAPVDGPADTSTAISARVTGKRRKR